MCRPCSGHCRRIKTTAPKVCPLAAWRRRFGVAKGLQRKTVQTENNRTYPAVFGFKHVFRPKRRRLIFKTIDVIYHLFFFFWMLPSVLFLMTVVLHKNEKYSAPCYLSWTFVFVFQIRHKKSQKLRTFILHIFRLLLERLLFVCFFLFF